MVGWSGQRESDPCFLLGREACHHNTLAAWLTLLFLSSAAGAPAAHEPLLERTASDLIDLAHQRSLVAAAHHPFWPQPASCAYRLFLSRGHSPQGRGAHRPPGPVYYLAAAASLARCRVVVLTIASRSPPLIPAMYLTSFFRDSMSYCVVMAICSMIGEPPPW